MPKLLILAPCDNVLINKDAESASLIVIMTTLIFPPPPPEIPVGTPTPMRWFFFCQWEILPEDSGLTYEQRIQLQDESGHSHVDTSTQMLCDAEKIHHRVIAGFNAIPLMPEGAYRFVVDLRLTDSEEWVNAGSYPMKIAYADSK